MFFVLSGFLITSILVKDRDMPAALYFKRFYWRRALRIFPLYFAYLGAFAIVYFSTGWPRGYGNQLPYLLTYLHNFWFLVSGLSSGGFTFHLWSLSVEEQFYLLWPLVIFLLSQTAFRRLLIVLIFAGPVLRFLTVALVANYTSVPDPTIAAIRLTYCQFDAFATGAAVAIIGHRSGRRAAPIFFAATVALLLAGQINRLAASGHLAVDTALGYREQMSLNFQYVWGYSAINAWSASLILAALTPNLLSRLLSWAPLVYIGRISYGMYILHLATFRGVHWLIGERHGAENALKFAAYLAALVLISTASYRWLESPFLRVKDRHFGREAMAAQPSSD